jgi:uncharacterized protein (DUF1330 family)
VPRPVPFGYFLTLSAISDLPRFQQYRSVLAKLRGVYSGRDLVQARPVTSVIGRKADLRLTLVEHPSVEDARLLLSAPEYVAMTDVLKILAPGPVWLAKGVLPRPDPLESEHPRAYVVTRSRIVDSVRLAVYQDLLVNLIAARGGRYLVRFDAAECLTGPADGNVLSVIEFPSMEHLQAGLQSPDFRDMMKMGIGITYEGFWIASAGTPEGSESPSA